MTGGGPADAAVVGRCDHQVAIGGAEVVPGHVHVTVVRAAGVVIYPGGSDGRRRCPRARTAPTAQLVPHTEHQDPRPSTPQSPPPEIHTVYQALYLLLYNATGSPKLVP